LFGCIVSSGADELAHDVTGAGAVSRPYRGVAVIFGLAGLSQWSLGTWDWNRPCPRPLRARWRAPSGCRPRAPRGGRSTGRVRKNVLRPVGSGHVPTPLGASRSDHLLTPQTRQRSNGSADQGQNFYQKNIQEFQSVIAYGNGMARGRGPPCHAEVHSLNQGDGDPVKRWSPRMRRTDRSPPYALSGALPSRIVSPSAADLANP